MIEPQPFQLAFGDQPFNQSMDGFERGGILDPQSRERVDVKKAPVIDVARSEPPMGQSVMLAFEQVMQCQGLHGPIRTGPISLESLLDDLGAASDALQLSFEAGCLVAIGMAQSLVAGGELENAFACRGVFVPCFADRVAQN